MNLIQLAGAVELGLIYSIVALGVYLSFRILQFSDLSVDGTFPLGAAVCAALVVNNVHPAYAIITAMFVGALAGWLTAWLSTHLGMLNLLAGILTMTALYSINLRIMGRPNIALLGEKNIFDEWFNCLKLYSNIGWRLIPLSLIMIALVTLMYWFLKTDIGLALRATGNNSRMGRAQGINDRIMIWLGLAFSNALVALGGALFTQVHGFADVTMGGGTIIIGLAAVIIGESIISKYNIFSALASCVVGAVLYRLLIAIALNIDNIGLVASDLNLITAILVAFAMILPTIKGKIYSKKMK